MMSGSTITTIRHINAKFKQDYSSSLTEMIEDIMKFPPYVSHFKYLAMMVSKLMTIWILTQADNVSREQICMQNHK